MRDTETQTTLKLINWVNDILRLNSCLWKFQSYSNNHLHLLQVVSKSKIFVPKCSLLNRISALKSSSKVLWRQLGMQGSQLNRLVALRLLGYWSGFAELRFYVEMGFWSWTFYRSVLFEDAGNGLCEKFWFLHLFSVFFSVCLFFFL